jgi:mono/diheme cytochrome c family protein
LANSIGWLAAAGLGLALCAGGARAEKHGELARGEYLLRAGGCIPCHTDFKGQGELLAGGRALATPFGTFFSPNITPDIETGIGRWPEADFLAALKQGVRPDGSHYFPVFPYPSYARMSDADALAIRAYLLSRPPVKRTNRPHDMPWPASWRALQGVWKALHFKPGEFRADPARNDAYNRGAYLVTALTHCGECHTPRTLLGAMQTDKPLAGTADGPDGELAPNITPDRNTGIGKWSAGDVIELLRTRTKPDFDNVQGSMREAVEHGLKYLNDADLAAIADYILAQPPIANRVVRRGKRDK